MYVLKITLSADAVISLRALSAKRHKRISI